MQFNESFAGLFRKCGEFQEEPNLTTVRALILFWLLSCKRKWYETTKTYICKDIFLLPSIKQQELTDTLFIPFDLVLYGSKKTWTRICSKLKPLLYLTSGDLRTLGGNIWPRQSKISLTYCSNYWSCENLGAV